MEFIRAEALTKQFHIQRHWWNIPEVVPAVDAVSFAIGKGESFGLVGESGCGKSTLAQLIVLLLEPNLGKVYFNEVEITGLGYGQRRELRKKMQIVFQDAGASLNPRFTVAETLKEPLGNFGFTDERSVNQSVKDILDAVELSERLLHRFPHELSGGEKQRVSIARALMLKPEFIVFDEVTTGLDVTLQYRILQLLSRLRREFGLTYLFITHDLQIIPAATNSVGIMREGRIVEVLSSEDIFRAEHPYTRKLLGAIPVRHPRLRKSIVI